MHNVLIQFCDISLITLLSWWYGREKLDFFVTVEIFFEKKNQGKF